MAPSFNPATGLFYVITLEQCDVFTSSAKEPEPKKNFSGGGASPKPTEVGQFVLRAFDPVTGKRVWQYPMTGPAEMWAGTVSTAGGVVFFGDDDGHLVGVDAKTGKVLWQADPKVDQGIWQSRICCGVVNRGLVLYKNKVIAPVVDGRLRALNPKDGGVLWESRVSPANMAYTITMAPRVIKGGKVIVGVSGGEYAVRGYFDAFDAETGERAWRFTDDPAHAWIRGSWAEQDIDPRLPMASPRRHA